MSCCANHVEEGEYAVKGISNYYNALVGVEWFTADPLRVVRFDNPHLIVNLTFTSEAHFFELLIQWSLQLTI